MLNMIVLGRITNIKRQMGESVNLKFTATRMLLLIGQVQMTALTAAINDDSVHKHSQILKIVKQKLGMELAWTLTQDQARLLHSALLPIECMLLAFVNLKFWSEPIRTKRR